MEPVCVQWKDTELLLPRDQHRSNKQSAHSVYTTICVKGESLRCIQHYHVTHIQNNSCYRMVFSSEKTEKCAHVVISKLIDFIQVKNLIQHNRMILYTFVYKNKTIFTDQLMLYEGRVEWLYSLVQWNCLTPPCPSSVSLDDATERSSQRVCCNTSPVWRHVAVFSCNANGRIRGDCV